MNYLTAAELKKLQVGMDFTKFSPEELDLVIAAASEVVENYCKRSFNAGTFTEKGQTIIDKQGRILVVVNNKPIAAVTSLELWLTGYGETRIEADLNYIDIFEKPGYMYYHTTHSPYAGTDVSYPSIVLGQSDYVNYEVVYTVTATLPADIKRAVAMITANMLKAEFFLREMNAPTIEQGVASFSSDDYSVNFVNTSEKNKGIITQSVRDILDRHVHIGQSSHF